MGNPADIVVLDAEARHCRRVALKAVHGLEFLLDLPQAVSLRGGDALVLEDGGLVEVLAAPEALAEISCKDQRQLVRLAYHFGNRHLPVQIVGQKLRIRRDHVIEDMARQGGARVTEIEAPFDPEPGAYAAEAVAGGHDHGHAGDDHEHDHAHSHDHHGHDHDGHAHDCHDHHDQH
jgi:urease accessory protein